ncbi:conserved Plasmodium protein, unknown function [Plasmodium vivax]|uniref:PH domain-containing protein n=2 Tax=Plasmodium vivax TaxID=5855 RepID=A0A1G4HK12_PLAVI|nr:hypothetical protein PVNG_00208 [Plasmodium vivax North Korean]SCO75284.1 conserved Plasmodium protein, unknown function [Plasmodium vivax]
MEERNVLEYAEVIIDRQRDKINELEKKLIELRSSSEELQKNALKNDEENKTLRLELNRKKENDMMLSMQLSKENEFLQKINVLEKQLLKRDTLLEELNNLLKKRKYEYELLLQEKENLTNTVNMMRSDICKNKKKEKLKEEEFLNNEKESENFLNLYKNNNEELHITKRCLIQIETELHLYKKQNEKQKNEIQRLYKIISCMNKEKALTPPVVLALQNDYVRGRNGKALNDYMQVKTIQDPPPGLSTQMENKATILKHMSPEKKLQQRIAYDENLLKLNLMQSQEQKNLFNKILETLNKIQHVKSGDNKIDFFFSSNVLHFFESNKEQKFLCTNNASLNNSFSLTTESAEDSSHLSDASSNNPLEKKAHLRKSKKDKKRKKKQKKEKKKKKKKKKKNDMLPHAPFSIKKSKKGKKKKERRRVSAKHTLAGSEHSSSEDDNSDAQHGLVGKTNTISDGTSHGTSEETTSEEDTHSDGEGVESESGSSASSDGKSSHSKSDDDASSDSQSDSHPPRAKRKHQTGGTSDESASDTDGDNINHMKNKQSYTENKRALLNYENYKEKFIGITNKEIFIYNKKGDEEPVYIIKNKNVKNVKTFYSKQVYVLEYISFDNILQKHYFLIKNDDKSLRMFYALQYAGFIKHDVDKFEEEEEEEEEESKRDYVARLNKNYYENKAHSVSDQQERDSYYSKLSSSSPEITVNVFTPNGIDRNGNNVPYLCNNVLMKRNPKNNHLMLKNFNNKKAFINCQDYHMDYKNNKFTLYFNDFKDQHIILPKSKGCTGILQDILNQMSWKNSHQLCEPGNKDAYGDEDVDSSDVSSYDSEGLAAGKGKYDARGKMGERGANRGRAADRGMYAERERNGEGVREGVRDGGRDGDRDWSRDGGRDFFREVDRSRSREMAPKRESEGDRKMGIPRKGFTDKGVERENDKAKEREWEQKPEGEKEREGEKDTEGGKDDILANLNMPDKMEDTFCIKENVLYISKDGNPFKKDQMSFNDENAFKFQNENLQILKDDGAQELTFIKREENKDEETYIFHYPKKEKYDHLISKLSKNNFNVIQKNVYDKMKKQGKNEEREKKSFNAESDGNAEPGEDKIEKADKFIKNNQVVVIEKGVLSIYKDYGNENSVPIIKFTSDFCDVQANAQNGEISIKETSKDSSDRIVLDCLNKTEFHRWKNALCFGGFIKGENVSSSYMNLKKHIFSINLFDNLHIKSSVRVNNNFIYIYPNNEISKPLFSFDKEKIELVLISDLRKIRIYMQRDTIYEQRYDITIALARDFASIKEQIEKYNFHTLNKKKTHKIRKPFVLCKTNIIAIHKDKYKLKPDLILDKKNCTALFDKNKFTVTFKIKSKLDSTQEDIKTLTLSNAVNFNKWLVTLKVASFIPGFHELEDDISFPTIVFGHTCPEATSLLGKRNSFMDFFKK